MAYSGFLLKIGDYKVPAGKFISAQSYAAYRNTQTIDPYTDNNGRLHMGFLPLAPLKVEFSTPAMLTSSEFSEFMNNIKKQAIDGGVKRKFYCTAYIPELDDYVTELSYLADIKPTIYSAAGGVIKYNSIPITIVGGLAEDD